MARPSSATNADQQGAPPGTRRVPRGPRETSEQVAEAIAAAYANGVTRMKVQMLLPLIGATELDDWPGGIQQQFKAAEPMVADILRAVRDMECDPPLSGALKAEILDQGDAVGSWESDAVSCFLFPAASTLKRMKQMTEGKRLSIMINPQWQEGQVVSDFGIGPWRAANEAFVDSFEEVYSNVQFRMSAEDVRLLRVYPGDFQVHVVDKDTGSTDYVTSLPDRPRYKELEPLLAAREGSAASKTWVERLQDEIQWTQDSLKQPPRNPDE